MAIAIISAMEDEIQHYLDVCTVEETWDRAGLRIHQAWYADHRLRLVTAGVGKVNAALCTQLLVDAFDIDAVLCTGVAGALHDGLEIGDVVISQDCVQHDLKVDFLGLPRGQIPFSSLRFFSASEVLVELAQEANEDAGKLHVGRVCTGDEFIQDEMRRAEIREELDGDCVEMEGAAVGQVCTLNEVPFLLVRAISDRANGSSDVDFQEFLAVAAESSAQIILQLLRTLDTGLLAE